MSKTAVPPILRIVTRISILVGCGTIFKRTLNFNQSDPLFFICLDRALFILMTQMINVMKYEKCNTVIFLASEMSLKKLILPG